MQDVRPPEPVENSGTAPDGHTPAVSAVERAVEVSPPIRVTDEFLARARRNPTKFAAWTLRAIIDELIERRRRGGPLTVEQREDLAYEAGYESGLSDVDRAVLDAARHLIDLAINESRIVTEAEHMLAFQALVDADRARRETQP